MFPILTLGRDFSTLQNGITLLYKRGFQKDICLLLKTWEKFKEIPGFRWTTCSGSQRVCEPLLKCAKIDFPRGFQKKTKGKISIPWGSTIQCYFLYLKAHGLAQSKRQKETNKQTNENKKPFLDSHYQLLRVTKIWDIKIFTPSQESLSNLKLNIQFKNIRVSFLQRHLWPCQDIEILPFVPSVEVAFFATSFTSVTLQYLGQIPSARGHYTVQSTSFIWHFPWGRVAKKRALRLHRQL